MVKMGWSAGGHMTNKIITFTNRFKAAASVRRASNWAVPIPTRRPSCGPSERPGSGGTPWQKNAPIDLYWEHSPLKYASANVTTPTILPRRRRNDPQVPAPCRWSRCIVHSRATVSRIHLYIGPREPHWWAELRHQLFKANVELAWFESM